MVTCYIHDGSNSPTICSFSHTDLTAYLQQLQREAYEDMQAAKKAHALYAVKQYEDRYSNLIKHVDIYRPAVLMDHDEFVERTDAQVKETPGCLILAVHSRD